MRKAKADLTSTATKGTTSSSSSFFLQLLVVHNRFVLAFVFGLVLGVASTNFVALYQKLMADADNSLSSCHHRNQLLSTNDATNNDMPSALRSALAASAAAATSNSTTTNTTNATNSTTKAGSASAAAYFQFHEDLLELQWPYLGDAHFKKARIYVIHVGKAGGATINTRLLVLRMARKMIKCRIKNSHNLLRDPCYERFIGLDKRKKEARLTHRIYGHMHLEEPNEPSRAEWLRNNTNVLMWTIRDPVDRFVSAFNYHRYKVVERRMELLRKGVKGVSFDERSVRFFEECFSTVQHLADVIDPRKPDIVAKERQCHEWGVGVVTGRLVLPHMEHIAYNYQYYYKHALLSLENNVNNTDNHDDDDTALSKKTIAVVRAENLWGDVARLEGLLGGNPARFWGQTLRISHGSESYAVKTKVDAEGALALCCVMVEELEIYQTLVVAAQNLKRSEKRQTLLATLEKCGAIPPTTAGEEGANGNGDDTNNGADVLLSWKELANWKWSEWHKQTCHFLEA